MLPSGTITGDELLTLLGRNADDVRIQQSLTELAHGMEPEHVFENEEILVDWVTVNELGLEYGFEDEAYVQAADPQERNQGSLLLSQLYFYGDTPKTEAFPYPLPFGLTFQDDRSSTRRKLGEYESTRRSHMRDAWRLPNFDVTVAYRSDNGTLESVFCHVPYAPWPPLPGEAERLAPFTPEAFTALFGLRWSSSVLRARLAPLGFEETLPELRAAHAADLGLHGLELLFASGSQIMAADRQYPRSLSLAGVTYYASRERDAREWIGPLPFGLAFTDSQAEMRAKVGAEPAEVSDEDRSGTVMWHFALFTLIVLYSNIENRVLRISMLAPGFWEAINEDDGT